LSKGHAHLLTGIGATRTSSFLRRHHYDHALRVLDTEAFAYCRMLQGDTGLELGGSSGAVLAAFVSSLDGPLGGSRHPVVVVADGGDNYRTTFHPDIAELGPASTAEDQPPDGRLEHHQQADPGDHVGGDDGAPGVRHPGEVRSVGEAGVVGARGEVAGVDRAPPRTKSTPTAARPMYRHRLLRLASTAAMIVVTPHTSQRTISMAATS
jgi:hypothetical protein